MSDSDQFDVDKGTSTLLRRGSHVGRRAALKKPKSKHKQRQIEQRARWIVREWARSPTCTYAEMIDATRERFGIGFGGAEIAYARALEMERETVIDTNTTEKISAQLWRVFDRAFAEGKYNASVRAMNVLAQLHGIVAPQRHEVAITTVQQMQHLVMAMTPTQRANRERELLSRAAQLSAPAELAAETIVEPEGEIVGLSPAGAAAVAGIIDEDFSAPITGDDEVHGDDPEDGDGEL